MKQGIKMEKERHKSKGQKKSCTVSLLQILQEICSTSLKKSNNIRKENFWRERRENISLSLSINLSIFNNSEPSRYPQKSATQ
jgi:hypothetical protein